MGVGLKLSRSSSTFVSGFSGVDWADCVDDRCSTGGFAIFLGHNLISWSARKQATMSRSRTKAKYKVMANATSEIIWVQTLFQELGIKIPPSPRLWFHNIGATYLSTDHVFHGCTKHTKINYHFVSRASQKLLGIRIITTGVRIGLLNISWYTKDGRIQEQLEPGMAWLRLREGVSQCNVNLLDTYM